MEQLWVVAAWVTVGLVVSAWMVRRGHEPVSWMLLGAVMGPLTVLLVFDRYRHERLRPPVAVGPGSRGPGPVDVLVGIDGSPPAEAALAAVLEVVGPRLGRLALVTVLPGETAVGEERAEARREAEDRLERLAATVETCRPEIRIVLGSPAEELARLARSEGYDLLAVGNRGTGVRKVVLGSVAATLAKGAGIPVLVGGLDAEARG